ncbi:hypothetical protein QAD02_015354 [Eretmocerus hayati]|uniref:Uncharacterized protein n=1 Tax=Eretmocerus hayati TaxID=131215 RepID=A0ACC2P8E5_9HYME|nr:hypothetical protein QAD02_015354 [Eretmocerus hayati]
MVATCSVCGVERLPSGNTNRSFHKFPKSVDLREKWFEAIGRRISYKTAVVCSDHFTREDFRPHSESRPLLKTDAIPSIIFRNHSSSCHDDEGEPKEYPLSLDKIMSEANGNGDNLENSRRWSLEHLYITLEHSYSSAQTHRNLLANHKIYSQPPSQERIYDFSAVQDSSETHQYGIFRKEDFTSDVAWERFIKYISFTKSNMKSIIRKNSRLQTKVNYLQDLIDKVEKQNRLKINLKRRKS